MPGNFTGNGSVLLYKIQSRKYNETVWMDGTVVTFGGGLHVLTTVEDGLDPGQLYLLRVVPVVSPTQSESSTGNTLFVLSLSNKLYNFV